MGSQNNLPNQLRSLDQLHLLPIPFYFLVTSPPLLVSLSVPFDFYLPGIPHSLSLSFSPHPEPYPILMSNAPVAKPVLHPRQPLLGALEPLATVQDLIRCPRQHFCLLGELVPPATLKGLTCYQCLRFLLGELVPPATVKGLTCYQRPRQNSRHTAARSLSRRPTLSRLCWISCSLSNPSMSTRFACPTSSRLWPTYPSQRLSVSQPSTSKQQRYPAPRQMLSSNNRTPSQLTSISSQNIR